MRPAPVSPAGAAARGPATVPRLHAIAADEVLDRPDFADLARALLAWGGPDLALHLRAHGRAGGELFALAAALLPAAARSGALLVVNDRLDVALAAGLKAVQLGNRSLPLEAALRIAPRPMVFGYSAHGAAEAAEAAIAGAAWLLLGTIYETPSHAGRPGAGPQLIAATRAIAGAAPERGRAVPIVAIGGITPARVSDVLAAGAHGVAVLRGVWAAPDPLAAAATFRTALESGVRDVEAGE